MTILDLKKLIEGLPDDMPVVASQSFKNRGFYTPCIETSKVLLLETNSAAISVFALLFPTSPMIINASPN